MSRAERRLVTCLFVDVVGSTHLTVRLGPERMRRMLDEAFANIREVVHEHGGTIEKYVGDAILVLFGAPVTRTDDAERALRAADACALKAAPRSAREVNLSVRVGVETGEALVDLEAMGADQQRIAVGTCVNLAARLQQFAEPGTVLVGPGCHEATRDVAEFESLAPTELKGLGTVPIWRLLRVAGASASVPLPFVGRRGELEQLRAAYDRARVGHTTLALVTGPPGQGKTRLAEEFAREVGDEVRLLQARCRPGGESGSRTPLREFLAADVPDATPEAVAARVVALLDDSEESVRVAATLCHSAGLSVDERLLALRPVERELEIAAAWRRYLAALGSEHPVMLWIEDVHWAETQLVRLIDRLTLSAQMPLLVLLTGRPEFAGTAMLRPTDDRIFLELGLLDPASAVALGRSLGATDDQTIERAEGHPLFIIELVRSRLAARADLPLTVHAVIAARLDELPPSDRELLQCAAVAGETFDVRDAAVLSERDPAEIAGALARFAHLRYLHPVGQAYRFHHALVRDVAYARLPVAERMRLHARYVQEGVSPEDAEALAHHWWEALRPPDADWVWEGSPEHESMRREALRAHVAAGRRLVDRFERERAIDIYRRALELARNPKETAMIEAAIGFAYTRDARGDEAWEHRVRAIESYRQAGSPPPASLYADMLDPPIFNFGHFRAVPPEDIVLGLLEEGQRVAREARDEWSLARLLVQRAYLTGFDATIAAEAVRIADESAEPTQFADVLARACVVFLVAGELPLLESTFVRMDRLVEAGGQINEPEAVMWRSVAALMTGELSRADAFADRLLEISVRSNPHVRQHATALKALVLLARGDWVGANALARDTEALVMSHPGVGFCLAGAAASAYGAIVGLLAGTGLPDTLPAFVERCVPGSAYVRASTLLLPYVMAGRRDVDPLALESWRVSRLWDRQIWDPFGVTLAIALTIQERWADLEEPLRRLDEVAARGGGLCGALAAAIREEKAAANGGSRPTHAMLRDLGYFGFSELLSFHPQATTLA